MAKKEFSARKLDVAAFAQEQAELSGREELAAFPRLRAETQGDVGDREVQWHARGEMRNPLHVHPQVWLHLDARVRLPMTCQRCLAPVDIDLHVDRAFRFAPDEASAAAQDDESEEDVLAISRTFDLPELVEDELLMEVPVVPRHDSCPEPVRLTAFDEGFDEAQERPNPFAVLGRLKDQS